MSKHPFVATCILLVVGSLCQAQPLTVIQNEPKPKAVQPKVEGPIDLPKEITTKPGRLVKIEAKVAPGVEVLWDHGNNPLVDFIPLPTPNSNIVHAVFQEADDGAEYTVRILAIVATEKNKAALAACVVTVEGKKLPPPKPVPPPTDPLVKALQEGYDKDKSDDQRAARLKLLIELMDAAVEMSTSSDVKTLKQLVDAVHTTAETKIGKSSQGALTGTRQAVGTYLNGTLPTSVAVDAKITDSERNRAKAAYQTVATALRGIKP